MVRQLPFSEEHEMFRSMVQDFLKKEVIPYHTQWEEEGIVPREVWEKAGELGMICPNFPEEYGGLGTDFLYNIIVIEELAKAMASGFFISLHADVVAPYILHYGNEEQKRRWLPDIIKGKKILAIAMTEPGAGSDLASLSTKAEDKGDYFLLNGQKTFISNGYLADLVVVAARTGEGQGGISLLVVERGMEGFERGRKLKKVGLHAQDTAELIFSDVKVPKENLLGKLNQGFRYLMQSLAQERLVLAVSNMTSAEKVLDITVEYVTQRKAFGRKISDFQNTRHKLVDMYVEQECTRAFLDRVILAHMRGEKTTVEASMVKLQCSEMLKRHVDTCLQFFGGYGYMLEYPIAKAYLDARVQTIYAGTSEIMKEIITRNLGI
ncbi:MAG: acyl-CoA dehydrogenase family protein [Leptospiraceae bacterium]|nr:acyl-CoA dehydrogenase family protein [Leptospiraceae bacterium]MDW8307218.1 acyl-CoA dehydrogenase family protein [Leptospiraceae bacterium]